MRHRGNILGWEAPGWAVVTGASSGIGSEFAWQLAGQGFSLMLVARRLERLEALAKTLRGSFGIATQVVAADLSRPGDTKALAGRLRSLDALDVLVNNAGSATVGPFATSDPDAQAALVHLQVAAPVILARAAIPRMIARRRGLLVFTSSLSAFMPAPGSGVYIPAKAFLAAFAGILAPELEAQGVRVQALCPGYTRTGFHDDPAYDGLKSFLPRWVWGSSRAVVSASLRAAARGRIMVVPGLLNRLTLRLIPKKLMLRAYMKKRWAAVQAAGSVAGPGRNGET